jgi:hypothetical protein
MLPVNQMAFCMADHKTDSCCYAATSLLLCDDILGKVAGFSLNAGRRAMLMNATSGTALPLSWPYLETGMASHMPSLPVPYTSYGIPIFV